MESHEHELAEAERAYAIAVDQLNQGVQAARATYQATMSRLHAEFAAGSAHAQRTYAATVTGLNDATARARFRRDELAARLCPQFPPPPMRQPARPEVSTRTGQNVLFVLGGILLGSAAIVLTTVGWANSDMGGRAAIVGVLTLLVLALPPLALWRKLRATAETFAALGMLLLALVGYAAWYVDLFGVQDRAEPGAYAAGVLAGTAVVAVAYARLTRLVGPRFAALVAAQPVGPLLAADSTFGPAGWVLVLAGVALADLAVLWLVQVRADRSAPRLVLMIFAGVLGGLALLVAGLLAVVAVVLPGTLADAARAGGALLAVALVLSAALTLHRRLRPGIAPVLMVAVFVAGTRLLFLGRPDEAYALVALGVLGFAGLSTVLPRSARVGVLVTGAVPAVGAAALSLFGGAETMFRALPLWHADLNAVPRFDWQLPVVVALLTAAAYVLRRAPWVLAYGATALALAAPAALDLPWWGGPALAGLVLVPLVLWTARGTFAVPAAVLAGYSVVAGLARPVSTVAVLCGLIGLATFIVVADRRAVGWRIAAGAGIAVLPGLAAAVAEVVAGNPTLTRWAALGGLAVGVGVLVALRQWRPSVVDPGVAGLGSAGVVLVGVGLAEPTFALYAALVTLCAVAAVTVTRVERPWVLVALVPALSTVAGVSPELVDVWLGPYRVLAVVWDGVPTVVTRTDWWAAAALGVLALSTVGTGLRWEWALLPGASAVLVAVSGAPWPTLPAVTLAFGLVSIVVGALRGGVPYGVLGWVASGAGVAGALPTRVTTLVALAAVLAACAVCAAAGRQAAPRTLGVIFGVGTAAALAFVSALTADVGLPSAALWALVPAGLAVFARWRAAEATAHGVAAGVVLLTLGSVPHTLAALTLWGLAIGLTALLRPEHRAARVAVAGTCELSAYWLALWTWTAAALEAYTVPLAAVALFAGWLAARRQETLNSWLAYGPALLAGFGPSLGILLMTDGAPLRRLLVGLAALGVVVLGVVRRMQSPVVVGGVVLVVVAVHEAVLLWTRVPQWVPLALGGLLLVTLAITYERRLRDLVRLRAAVGKMR